MTRPKGFRIDAALVADIARIARKHDLTVEQVGMAATACDHVLHWLQERKDEAHVRECGGDPPLSWKEARQQALDDAQEFGAEDYFEWVKNELKALPPQEAKLRNLAEIVAWGNENFEANKG
jgi:hypothetical protein